MVCHIAVVMDLEVTNQFREAAAKTPKSIWIQDEGVRRISQNQNLIDMEKCVEFQHRRRRPLYGRHLR